MLAQEFSKMIMLAYRDLLKFMRDRGRIIATFVFPVIFVGGFGFTLQSGLKGAGTVLPYNYRDFIFSGVLLQTVFQSSLSGIVSLVEDREKDFAMGIFVAPVSRFTIVLGKVIGESLVSFFQAVGILLFGLLIGVSFTPTQLLLGTIVALASSFVGASFGVLISSRLSNAEDVRRIFPFIIFPMIFLSGAFTPVKGIEFPFNLATILNPLFYGVDLVRGVMFMGNPAKDSIVQNSVLYNSVIFMGLGILFFVVGSILFIQKEGNK
jgi:ABC-2 type transport system permease protein